MMLLIATMVGGLVDVVVQSVHKFVHRGIDYEMPFLSLMSGFG